MGTPAYVPSSKTLWWPQRAGSVEGFPAPSLAPTAVFNISRGQFEKFDVNITNASAIAYDPGNGLLYAAEPATDSVTVASPVTGAIVAPPIPVGSDPSAVVFDSGANSIIVANSGSANLTVIDPLDNRVSIGNVPVGIDPTSVVDDSQDGFLFVANAGSDFVTTVSADDPADILAQITLLYGPSTSLAFSPRTDNLVATIPSSDFATIINAETKTVVTSVIEVGKDFNSAVTTGNGTEFVIGNSSAGSLAVLNSSFGTIIDSSLSVEKNASQLVLDPATGAIFCWSTETRVLELLNLTSNTAIPETSTTLPQLVSVAYSPMGTSLLVSGGNSSLIYVQGPTEFGQSSPQITTASPALSFAENAARALLYVGTTNGLEIYNASSYRFVEDVPGLSGRTSQLVLDSEDNLLWLVNSFSGVEAVNLTTNQLQISTELSVTPGSGPQIALDPSASLLFVLNSSSIIEVLSSRTGVLAHPGISAGTNLTSVVFDPVDNQVYAAGDQVSLLNATSLEVDGEPIQIGGAHKVLSELYEPSREEVFVASAGLLPGNEGTITGLDGSSVAASESATEQIPVGEQPDAFAVVPAANSTVPGSATIWVANELSGTVSVIAGPPQIQYFAATPSTIDLGYTTKLNVTFVGGAGDSRITYFGLPPGCESESSTTLSCTPTTTGTFTLSVNVTDSFGFWANQSTSLIVTRALAIAVGFSPATFPYVEPGTVVDCTASASYGLPPYSFSWTFSDGTELSGATVTHSFSSPGIYEVTAVVRDATGASNTSSVAVVVVPHPSVVVSATPGNVTDVDVPVTFNATVSGGTGTLQENWTFGDGSRANGANVSHEWSRAGNYTVTFDYEDLLGVVASGSVEVTVHSSLEATLSSGSVSVSNPTTPATPISFAALVSGGTPPYAVTWAFGDGSFAAGLTTSHSYASPGRYTVEATLVDRVGAKVTANLTLAVSSPSSGGSLTSLTGGFGAGLFLGFLIGGVLAAVVLFSIGYRKGGRSRGGPVSPYVPP